MLKGALSLVMMVFVVTCVLTLLLLATARQLAVARGLIPVRPEEDPEDEVKVVCVGEAASPAVRAAETASPQE